MVWVSCPIILPGVDLHPAGPSVRSVTLVDILSVSPAPTYIIKTDLQGYDCRVFSDLRLYNSDIFIPFIHMELSNMYNNSNKEDCDRTVEVLTDHGYHPHIKLAVRFYTEQS